MENTKTREADKLRPVLDGMEEHEVPETACEQCPKHGRHNVPIRLICDRPSERVDGVSLTGIVTCDYDGHRWPVRLKDNVLIETAPRLPGAIDLDPDVPPGIQQDVQEASSAVVYGLAKSCVVMCRRAIQLAIEDKDQSVKGKRKTLGQLMPNAQKLLTARRYAQVEGIKDFGDGGAHREEEIESEDARSMIHITTQVLNELYQ